MTSPADRVADSLELVAETGPVFAGFAPYVPAIAGDGTVVFSATLAGGGSGVFRRDPDTAAPVAVQSAGIAHVISHPDLNEVGDLCFYGQTDAGEDVLVREKNGAVRSFLGAGRSAGPLGPTMNKVGSIAFRFSESGRAAVGLIEADTLRVIAREDERISGFEGLPVVSDSGDVFFRSRLRSGGEAIERSDGESLQVVVETGARFGALARFPAVNASGTVVFAAGETSGREGIYVSAAGDARCVVDSSAGFESFRGALISDSGDIVFFATRSGEALGVYRLGQGDDVTPVVALGDELFGERLSELALNAVSINAAGDLAIRLGFVGRSQRLVRSRFGNRFP